MATSPNDLETAQKVLLARQAESRERRLAARNQPSAGEPPVDLPPWVDDSGIEHQASGDSESPIASGDGAVPGDERQKAIERIEWLRRRNGIRVRSAPQVGIEVVADLLAEVRAAAERAALAAAESGGQEAPALAEREVKVYPDMGIGAYKGGEVAPFQVWLLCRGLDEGGQGWVDLEVVRRLAEGGMAVRLRYGWRRLRQVLNQGEGRFWKRDRKNGRLWLFSAEKVAAALGVERLGGWPVLLSIQDVASKSFKAWLYTAWHSGRRHDNPISREKQQEIMGIPERTQRHYCRVAGIERERNIAIGEGYTKARFEELSWQHGRSTFVFRDKEGRQGRRNGRYVAWQLPCSHKARCSRARKGRQRKINRKLKDLVDKRARGNSNKQVDRLFHPNGAAAGKAYNRRPDVDAYWTTDRAGGETNLWRCLTAQV